MDQAAKETDVSRAAGKRHRLVAFERFEDDVRARGVRVTIVTLEGMILDGPN